MSVALLALFEQQEATVHYVWGGANPATGADCSGLLNWDVNRVLGHPIPGYPRPGSFPGTPVHGPVVSDWLATSLAVTVAQPVAGDIVIFPPDVHVGVYKGDGQMVSALNPQLGVAETPVAATVPGVSPVYRRILGLPVTAAVAAAAGALAPGPGAAAGPGVPLAIAGGLAVVVLLAVAGVLVVVAGVLTGGRAGQVRAAAVAA